jgi:hypothetical protein
VIASGLMGVGMLVRHESLLPVIATIAIFTAAALNADG